MSFAVGGKLEARFQRRAEELKAISQKPLGMKITVPKGYEWWFYQEYGTAVRGDQPYASGDTFDIIPKDGETLKFEGLDGKTVYPKEVTDHEGIYPKRYIRSIRRDIQRAQRRVIMELIKTGHLTKANIKQALREAMRETKSLIVDSMDRALPGTNPDGKLGGETAASVFERVSRITATNGDVD